MYNLRYHLASLVAVFFALALGLLLGSVVAERGYLDEQQTALVEGLQADFADLNAENSALSDGFERDHDFAVQLADAYTRGILEGKTVLVIGNEGRSDGLAATNSTIIEAGGDVVTVVLREPGLGLDIPSVLGTLGSLISSETAFEGDPVSRALVNLASELATPAPEARPYLNALVDAEILEIEGLEPGAAVDGVVLVASFDGEPDPILVRLLSRMRDAGVTALGVEPSWTDVGVVSACLEAGLSAVDAIDAPQGSMAMAFVLAGRAEGHFGLRDGASELNPSSIESD